MRIPSGKVDQLIYFVAVDITDLKTRETGLTSFTVYRSRNGAAAAIYTTPTVAELSAANMPGVYSLAIDEDTTIAAGSDSEEYCVHITQASMAPVTRTIELYRRDTTTGNTLDVTATGAAGVDWGNVENKTTVNALTNTSIITTQQVDVNTIKTNPVVNAGTITFPTTATLASTTNITAGTVTTVTNLTNAPTSGDLTATMKTSVSTAVWSADATSFQTQGTFGQAIGDPVADTNTIYKAVVTDAAGATVGVDVVAVKAETASIQSDTNDLQTQVGTAGAGLTNINLPDQTMNITGNITGNLSGSVGSVTGLTAANLDVAVSTRMATYTQPTGFLAATFPAGTVANTTNITAGTMTTTTNLTTNNDKTGYALTAAGDNSVADALLARNVAGGSSAGRLVKESLYVLRNKTAIAAGTLTVYGVDDTTPAFTAAVTTAAGNPIDSIDPA